MFIFDVFPLATNWVVVEVERCDEFAPVKNEPGHTTDSPDTAMLLMSNQAKRWLLKAGANIINTSTVNTKDDIYEISPLLSYDGEGLDKFNGINISSPVYLIN
jgi:UDP-N-acetylglucosamine/UDP-N-acetylgalactosamine diphosphorylase